MGFRRPKDSIYRIPSMALYYYSKIGPSSPLIPLSCRFSSSTDKIIRGEDASLVLLSNSVIQKPSHHLVVAL